MPDKETDRNGNRGQFYRFNNIEDLKLDLMEQIQGNIEKGQDVNVLKANITPEFMSQVETLAKKHHLDPFSTATNLAFMISYIIDMYIGDNAEMKDDIARLMGDLIHDIRNVRGFNDGDT